MYIALPKRYHSADQLIKENCNLKFGYIKNLIVSL